MAEYTLKKIRKDLSEIKEIGAHNVIMIGTSGDRIYRCCRVDEIEHVEELFVAIDDDYHQFYALFEENGILPDIPGDSNKWSPWLDKSR